MNRFPIDRTTEIIVPLPHRRGVRVVLPLDLDPMEWEDVSSVVLGRIAEKRAAETSPGEKRPATFACAGQ